MSSTDPETGNQSIGRVLWANAGAPIARINSSNVTAMHILRFWDSLIEK
jgi:hypothetical protein